MLCLALVLYFGLAGGLVAMVLGEVFSSSDREDGR